MFLEFLGFLQILLGRQTNRKNQVLCKPWVEVCCQPRQTIYQALTTPLKSQQKCRQKPEWSLSLCRLNSGHLTVLSLQASPDRLTGEHKCLTSQPRKLPQKVLAIAH